MKQKIIFIIFLFVGLVMGGFGIFSFIGTVGFMRNSQVTTGEVTDFDINTRREYDENNERWETKTSSVKEIEFQTEEGETIIFELTGSDDDARIGESIPIRYKIDNPDDARVNNFFGVWGVSIIMTFMSVVFVAIPSVAFIALRNGAKKKETYTNLLNLPVKQIYLDETFEMDGRNPYRIYAEYLHPVENKIYEFKSERLWNDPTTYVPETVTVYTDPLDYKKYHMDTSFMPEKA